MKETSIVEVTIEFHQTILAFRGIPGIRLKTLHNQLFRSFVGMFWGRKTPSSGAELTIALV